MIVGDLLIQIGITGASKVGDALSSVSKGLGEITSLSLESKAAILGSVYALEHFMSQSAQMGMSLKQFSAFTGMSTDELQRWQYAARQAGVSAEEVTSSIEGIQSTIAKIQMGKGPTGGFAPIANFTGGFDYSKVNDALYVLKKVREFAKSDKVPRAFANEWMVEAGFSKNMIQFLRTTETDMEKIRPTNIFSTREIERLAKVQVAWANLHRTFEMSTGHFTAQFGMTAVKGLSVALKQVIDLTSNIQKLIQQFPMLESAAVAIGAVLAATFAPVTATLAAIIYSLNEIQKYREGKENIFEKSFKAGEKAVSVGDNFMHYLTSDEAKKDAAEAWNKITGKAPVPEPKYTGPTPAIGGTTQTVNVTHYGQVGDTKDVVDTHKKAAEKFYRTNPAQLQVN